MRREQLPLYAIALAVLVVGLAFAGVPVSTLLVLPLILVCPLMMIFMMRGMDHEGPRHDQRSDHEDLDDHHDASGRWTHPSHSQWTPRRFAPWVLTRCSSRGRPRALGKEA
jgi:hypothetical protein